MTAASRGAVRVRHHRSGRLDIELHRPERRNALTVPMVARLAEAIREAQADDSVTSVLLYGAGGCFSAGVDLVEMQSDGPAISAAIEDLHRNLSRLDKPLVGALERAAVNGAAAVALACDLLVVGERSFLEIGEARMGIAAPNNLRWLLAKYSPNQALQLTLACERQYGPDLLRRNIAYAVVPDGEVLERATALAEGIAGYPASAGAAMKRSIAAGGPEPR
ncbi:enoyl-CoA hydratase/isomerase family protein [Rhodococcus sp. (in: high G+C Gram-positive bacteria)]|uniref:enoyl-CoA hydratase/isomerase family protein n=1 Tax=Rhodococcus sp. TaxID=1831 RepID=UPI003B8A839C